MSRLILVRHANTFEPTEAAYWVGAHQDLPLSRSGQEQLPDLQRRIATLGFAQSAEIFSSPLQRARATAEIFSKPIKMDPRLTELDFGPWSGKTEAQIVAQFAEATADLIAWREQSIVPATWGLDEERKLTELTAFLAHCASLPATCAVTSNGCLKLIGKLIGGNGPWNVKTARYCELEYQSTEWRIIAWNQ